MIYLGKNLKLLRKKFNLSQSQLASQLGKRDTAISSWENGGSEPSIKDVAILCKIFAVSSDVLFFTELTDVQVSSIENTPENHKNVQVNVLPNVQVMDTGMPQTPQSGEPDPPPSLPRKHLENIIDVLTISVKGLEASNAVLIRELQECRHQNTALKREIPKINPGMDHPEARSAG